MTCDDYRDAIQELVDGTLTGVRRQELEAHLTGCPSCTALVEELLVVRRAARSLPVMTPPDRVWDRLAPIVSAGTVEPRRFGWRDRVMVPLAVAAVILAAVLITLVSRMPEAEQTREAPATVAPPASDTSTSADLGSLEAELRQAETHYENAIQKLEALAQDQQTLDPQMAKELQKNLVVIDQAIGESRAALRTQPANERAQESLFEAFRTKIALLQDTLALINEMRKGNQTEAARIAAGLSKS